MDKAVLTEDGLVAGDDRRRRPLRPNLTVGCARRGSIRVRGRVVAVVGGCVVITGWRARA